MAEPTRVAPIALAFETIAKFKHCQLPAEALEFCVELNGGAGIAAEAICLNQRQAYEQCILANGKKILNEIGQSAARHCPEEMDRFERCAKAHGADSCLGENKATLVCGAEAVLRRLRRVG